MADSSVMMPFGSVGQPNPTRPRRSVPISPRDTSAKNSTCGAKKNSDTRKPTWNA
jgi:hypothetical protein